MTDAERYDAFWAKVEKLPGDGCWIWRGCIDAASGYGRVYREVVGVRVVIAAHVLAWTMEVGPLPPRTVLMPKCGNRACVRPDHHEPGKKGEQIAPRVGPKLSSEQIAAVVARRRQGETIAALAAEFGVTFTTVAHHSRRAGVATHPGSRKPRNLMPRKRVARPVFLHGRRAPLPRRAGGQACP